MEDTPRDKRIPYYFVAFFVGLTILLVGFVTIAVRTQTGVVTQERPYEVGLAYNKVIQAADAQAALGWKAQIAFAPASDEPRAGTITVQLSDAKGVVLTPKKITLAISRPTQDGHDFKQACPLKGDHCAADVTFPLQGQWDVRAFATVGEQAYQQSTRVVVP